MKKFEYRVMNLSEVTIKNKKEPMKKSWLDLLNDLGKDGWEFCTQPTKQSFLLKREVL